MTPASGDPGWTYRVQEASHGATRGVLFLLHGTGGDETSLLELAAAIARDHLLVGVRGRSDEEGVTRYFRRYDALRYDQDHLTSEARSLARFVRSFPAERGLEDLPRRALGYSNGANIALASALLDPGCFAAMALLRSVQPFDRAPRTPLDGLAALLLFGRHDPYYPAGRSLPGYLTELGAAVDHTVLDAGHGLTYDDVTAIEAWLKGDPGA